MIIYVSNIYKSSEIRDAIQSVGISLLDYNFSGYLMNSTGTEYMRMYEVYGLTDEDIVYINIRFGIIIMQKL